MKKLGIVTFNRASNYGALLQAYALKRVCERLGYESHVVDYALRRDDGPHPWKTFLRSRCSGKAFFRLMKSLLSYPWDKKRWKACRYFRDKYLDETKPCTDSAEISWLGFDAYVMGSDQIWNYHITGGRFDPVLFGRLPSEACCVVYGASAQDTPFPLAQEIKFQDLLEEIDSPVGIREKKLAEYAGALTGKRYPVVLDPTLLAGKEEIETVESNHCCKEPYILLYQIDSNPYSDISIASLEKRFGRRVYSMTVPKLGSTHGKKGGGGPGEFLALLDHADFLVTNSFHGIALSLLWHKQFFVYENGGVMTRIDDLLDTFGLRDRKVRMVLDIDPDRTIDYSQIDRTLEEERTKSISFLQNALSGELCVAPLTEDRPEPALIPFLSRKKGDCSGCSACMEICPGGAISMKPDKEGFLYPTVNSADCLHCGRCDDFCAFISPPRRDREHLPQAFGVKHKETTTRKASRSGGAFVALSDCVLDRDGVVYGAAFCEDGVVRHIRAESKAERNRMQGAKYVQSDIVGIPHLVLQDLKAGRTVLFSGTPCQVAGIKKLLRYLKVDDRNLLTCDLVCHGVPSPQIWREYMDYIEHKHHSGIVKADFRDKTFGWDSHCETFLLENGKKVVSRDYTDLFYEHLIFRPSCHQCPFANVNRIGDVTLADFWGIEKNDPEFEDKNGVSLVLVNTEKGNAALIEAEKDLQIIECDIINCIQPTLIKPSTASPRRDMFWKSYWENGFTASLKRFVKPISTSQRIKREMKQLLFKVGIRNHP